MEGRARLSFPSPSRVRLGLGLEVLSRPPQCPSPQVPTRDPACPYPTFWAAALAGTSWARLELMSGRKDVATF